MSQNIDQQEILKFDSLATNWWNPEGEMQMLHRLNPLRLNYIKKHLTLDGKNVADIGCGAGILTESLARAGAVAVGIDQSPNAIAIAQQHAAQNNLIIDYQLLTAEELSCSNPEKFDAVTCMEMLEHVPDPGSILQACTTLLKSNGLLFVSTINRTPAAFLQAVIGAEYLMRLLPVGTHHYSQFIRPSELEKWGAQAGLALIDLCGVRYHLTNGEFQFSSNVNVNYLACFKK